MNTIQLLQQQKTVLPNDREEAFIVEESSWIQLKVPRTCIAALQL